MTKGQAKVIGVTLFVLAGFIILSGFVVSFILGGPIPFGISIFIAILLVGGGFFFLKRDYKSPKNPG